MKKLVTVHAWLLVFAMLSFWICGAAVGYSVGITCVKHVTFCLNANDHQETP